MSCPCDKLKEGCQDWSEYCIGNLWLFSGLEPHELLNVAKKALRRHYEAGESVFLQGEPAKSIFVIKSGQIRLSRLMENGTEVMMDIRKPGDYLGEYLLNDLESDYGYPVSAWCQTKVVACSFTRKAFEELILEFPAVGLKVIKTMAGRIASLTGRLEAMSQVRLEEKIHAVLLNVARKHGHKRSGGSYALDFQITHEDLGFLVGAHRVSVTRIMKKLKAAGRIDNEGKLLVVHGPAAVNFTGH
ncbi:MAG: Crp/Fnr family transcriptional regulator [Deltaproteobacteria bacterium]|jgi:CRP/FNR family transcriptional regulator|nr:Crp/Fnr family transcriptional regulator [Deltaproteobacteria bacterium]